MRKLILVLLMAIFIFSCSNDNLNDNIVGDVVESSPDIMQLVQEKYDGEIFRFDDNEDFVNFYNMLSNTSIEEFEKFLSVKDENNSSFYNDQFREEETDENDEDGLRIFEGDFIISQFISTIFNNENKIIISDKTILLDQSGDFIDIKSKEIIGYLANSLSEKTEYENSVQNRYNVNYTKTWLRTDGSKRVWLDIFNETIYINNIVSSSKVYYKISQQYKSCSFWRCTWKNDSRNASIYYLFPGNSRGTNTITNWPGLYQNYSPETFSTFSFTQKIAEYVFVAPMGMTAFHIIDGYIGYHSVFSYGFDNLEYSFDPFD